MGIMDLDDIKSSLHSTFCSASKVLHNLLDEFDSELLGLGVGVVEGDGRRAVDVLGPAADLLHSERRLGPRWEVGSLASCVGELDGDLLVLSLGKGADLGETSDMLVRPETNVPRADATSRLHGGGFDDCQSRAARDDPADCTNRGLDGLDLQVQRVSETHDGPCARE